jgi:hypothetical protein
MNDIIKARKPRQTITSMQAITDQASKGLPPERELRVYEFGNGTVTKKSADYSGTWNASTQQFE